VGYKSPLDWDCYTGPVTVYWYCVILYLLLVL
jgi:hypothetical protein